MIFQLLSVAFCVAAQHEREPLLIPVTNTRVNGINADIQLESLDPTNVVISFAAFDIAPNANRPQQFMTNILNRIAKDLVEQVMTDVEADSVWQNCEGWIEVQPTIGHIDKVTVDWGVAEFDIRNLDFTIPAFNITNQVSCEQKGGHRRTADDSQSSEDNHSVDSETESSTQDSPRKLVSKENAMDGATTAKIHGMSCASSYKDVKGTERKLPIFMFRPFSVALPNQATGMDLPSQSEFVTKPSIVRFEANGAPGAIEIEMSNKPSNAYLLLDNIVIPEFQMELPSFTIKSSPKRHLQKTEAFLI